MNAYTVIQNVSESIRRDAYLRDMTEKERRQAVTEQKSIQDEQIHTGMGAIEDNSYKVPYNVVGKLNSIPNPDRNGLVLLWAYNIYNLCEGNEDKMMDFITQVYKAGGVTIDTNQESGTQKTRGRKTKTTTAEGSFKLVREDMPNVSDSEYEKLQIFVDNCFLAGMRKSLKESKVVRFDVLAINLLKGVREVKLAMV